MNYYPFHVGDYLTHTAHLSPLEDIAYRRLLDLYYVNDGPLQGDAAALARRIRLRDNVVEVETILGEFFKLVDGVWRNGRCDAELSAMKAKREKAQASAAASVSARRAKAQPLHSACEATAEPVHGEGSATAEQSPNERSATAELPTPTPTPTPEERHARASRPPAPASDRGSRLPEGWTLPAEWRAWAAKERPDLDLDAVAERFADHWRAQPGADGRKADWLATWRNWVRSERAPAGAGYPGHGHAPGPRASDRDTDHVFS